MSDCQAAGVSSVGSTRQTASKSASGVLSSSANERTSQTKFDFSTPAGDVGREGFAEEERVVGPLAEQQDLARLADFDREIADVVAMERVVGDDPQKP